MFKAEDALWASRTNEMEPKLHILSRNTSLVTNHMGVQEHVALCGKRGTQWWGSDGTIPFCNYCVHVSGNFFNDLPILAYTDVLAAVSSLRLLGYSEASEALKKYFDGSIFSEPVP